METTSLSQVEKIAARMTRARYRKADKLARAWLAAGLEQEDPAVLLQEGPHRECLLNLAKANRASTPTWEIVVLLLRYWTHTIGVAAPILVDR